MRSFMRCDTVSWGFFLVFTVIIEKGEGIGYNSNIDNLLLVKLPGDIAEEVSNEK